jgi:hypothetical protein
LFAGLPCALFAAPPLFADRPPFASPFDALCALEALWEVPLLLLLLALALREVLLPLDALCEERWPLLALLLLLLLCEVPWLLEALWEVPWLLEALWEVPWLLLALWEVPWLLLLLWEVPWLFEALWPDDAPAPPPPPVLPPLPLPSVWAKAARGVARASARDRLPAVTARREERVDTGDLRVTRAVRTTRDVLCRQDNRT